MKLQHVPREFHLKKLNVTLCCLVAICLESPSFAQQTTQSKPSGSKSRQATARTTASSPGVKSAQKTSTRKKVASRSRKGRRPEVRGQRTIETARVLEIQNALAAAGYYKEQPNGQWDDSTSKAMSAYQQDNGFRTTGKPDALSLKKLGL